MQMFIYNDLKAIIILLEKYSLTKYEGLLESK